MSSEEKATTTKSSELTTKKRPSTAISTASQDAIVEDDGSHKPAAQEAFADNDKDDEDGGRKTKRQATANDKGGEDRSILLDLPVPTTPTGPPKVTWEPRIAQEIWKISQQQDSESGDKKKKTPLMVAVVGIPGSGKTTSASILVDLLKKEQGKNASIVMPMDGYHYSMAALKQMPQSQDLIYRRGAPDTFDASTLERDLDRIRTGEEEVVTLPGFDHAVGDPEPHQHSFVRNQHEIVLCEGLYLLHNGDGWEGMAKKFDFTVFVQADIDVCIERLKIRNQCIPGYTAEEINRRCDDVDRTNAHTVNHSRQFATVIVESSTAAPSKGEGGEKPKAEGEAAAGAEEDAPHTTS